jgi:hypothetical protein
VAIRTGNSVSYSKILIFYLELRLGKVVLFSAARALAAESRAITGILGISPAEVRGQKFASQFGGNPCLIFLFGVP